MDKVTPIELRTDLYRQFTLAHGVVGVAGIRCGQDEVAAHSDEHLDVPALHCLDRADGIEAVVPRRVDAASLGQTIEERGRRTMVDPARPVALNVAVPADRARTRTLAT